MSFFDLLVKTQWAIITLVAILVVLALFKKPISGLISRLKKVGRQGLGTAEFEKEQAEAEATSNVISEHAKETSTERRKTGELEAPADMEQDLFKQVLDAVKVNDTKKIASIGKKIVDSATTDYDKLLYSSVVQQLLYRTGEQGALEELKKLAQENLHSGVPRSTIAQIFWEAGSLVEAEKWFREASEVEEDKTRKLGYLLKRCDVLIALEEHGIARDLMCSEIGREYSDPQLAKIYRELGDIAESSGSNEEAVAYFEKALEINPGNVELRFQLAFKYSEMHRDGLAVFHYKQIVGVDDGALNNLGVQYQGLGFPVMAISSYREASEKGNTLADANIAKALVNAGFQKEATEVLKAAQSKENPHPNVYEELAAVKERSTKEQEEITKIEKRAEGNRKRILCLADLCSKGSIDLDYFVGKWEVDGGELVLKKAGGKLAGNMTIGDTSITLTGQQKGAAILLEWKTTSLLLNNSGPGYLCIDLEKQALQGVLFEYKNKEKQLDIDATKAEEKDNELSS